MGKIRLLREALYAEVDIPNPVYLDRNERLLMRINSNHEALVETYEALLQAESRLENDNLG
jgi:hypothetical protein